MGLTAALWRAFKFIVIISLICVFLYAYPPYRIKQTLNVIFDTFTAIGSVAHTVALDEKKAEAFTGHLLKSGRELWNSVKEDTGKLAEQISDDVHPIIELL